MESYTHEKRNNSIYGNPSASEYTFGKPSIPAISGVLQALMAGELLFTVSIDVGRHEGTLIISAVHGLRLNAATTPVA